MIKLATNYSINENNIKDSGSYNTGIMFIEKEKIISESICDIAVFAIEDPLYNINADISSQNEKEENFEVLSVNFNYKASIHRYEVLAFIITSLYWNGKKYYFIDAIDTTTNKNNLIKATCENSIIELYLSDKQFLYNGSNYKLIANKSFKYNKIEK